MTAYGSLISDLETAISSGNPERCAQALWQVTDLFITGAGQYSLEHAALFDDVIVRLAAEIEVKARAKLANRRAAESHEGACFRRRRRSCRAGAHAFRSACQPRPGRECQDQEPRTPACHFS